MVRYLINWSKVWACKIGDVGSQFVVFIAERSQQTEGRVEGQREVPGADKSLKDIKKEKGDKQI